MSETAKTIFLSYRREDTPGYVSRLEDELERAFGAGRVFRDVQDIRGGAKWRQVLEENLANCAVVVMVIGRRWQAIWEQRRGDAGTNFVAFELERARSLGIPVVPVTVDGGHLDDGLDLGEIGWIREHQFYDISDKQGRWSTDLAGLIRLLEGIEGVGPSHAADEPEAPPRGRAFGSLRWVAGIATVLVAGGAMVSLFVPVPWYEPEPEPPTGIGPLTEVMDQAPRLPTAVEVGRTPAATTDSETGLAGPPPSSGPVSVPLPAPGGEETPLPVPNIAGTWQGRDGRIYRVQQFGDGTFSVQSPGYADGTGRFMDRMPNKFELTMEGIGRGEFAVSTTGHRAIGYFVVNGQQVFDTLTRVE